MFWFTKRDTHAKCRERQALLEAERDAWRRRYVDLVILLVRRSKEKKHE